MSNEHQCEAPEANIDSDTQGSLGESETLKRSILFIYETSAPQDGLIARLCRRWTGARDRLWKRKRDAFRKQLEPSFKFAKSPVADNSAEYLSVLNDIENACARHQGARSEAISLLFAIFAFLLSLALTINSLTDNLDRLVTSLTIILSVVLVLIGCFTITKIFGFRSREIALLEKIIHERKTCLLVDEFYSQTH